MRQLDPVGLIATDQRLDRAASALRVAMRKVLRPGRVTSAVHGAGLGHPVRPALARVAVGCLTGAALLDLGGRTG